ncbi:MULTISPECIES: DNA polymerase III subunit delta [Sphingomonas]|uniref:DNA polymerase III subunit delta n=1 Tax=Sphingomonas TaxID=13687 RepID=UPI000DEF2561|nr:MULTISPECIES: DNA polymerase III subunit delta [Sphingomonas]
MKIAKGQVDRTVDRPDPATRLFLFAGEDESTSRALAARLLAALRAEKEPLTGAQLKSDPALLSDSASAISMFGGARLIWVEPAGDESLAAVEALLAAPAVEHPTVLIAGALKKTSGLLKAVDAHPAALSHLSYTPDAANMGRLVADLGRARGLRLSRDVADRLAASAGADQAIVAQELTKFALYLDASPERPQELSPEHLDRLGADAPDRDLARAGDLALSGALAELADELGVAEEAANDAIPMTRSLQRRLLQLAPLRARLDAGQPIDAVLTGIFWKDRALVGRMLSRWSSPRLAQALSRLAQVERQLLQGGAAPPPAATLGTELLQLARAGRR